MRRRGTSTCRQLEPDGLAQAIATGGAWYAPAWTLEAQLKALAA